MRLKFLALGLILLFGCNRPAENYPEYEYIYKVQITYTESSVDTLSYKAYDPVRFYINDGSETPCLIGRAGFGRDVLSCGVRKFKVIETSKSKLND